MSGIFKCLAFFSATSLISLVAKRVLAALSLPVVKPCLLRSQLIKYEEFLFSKLFNYVNNFGDMWH